jgi:hypothetical protein
VTFEPVTTLVGLELDDADGEFPSADDAMSFECASGSGVECFPDHDDDRRPGIGIVLQTEGEAPDKEGCRSFPHEAAPLNQNPFAIVGGVRRTNRLQLGVRLRVGIAGRLAADCAGAEGGGIAEFLQSRAAGCLAQPGSSNPFGRPAGANDPCTDSEVLFVNRSLPDYDALRLGEVPNPRLEIEHTAPSEGPHYRLVRIADLGEDVTCSEVRAALAP